MQQPCRNSPRTCPTANTTSLIVWSLCYSLQLLGRAPSFILTHGLQFLLYMKQDLHWWLLLRKLIWFFFRVYEKTDVKMETPHRRKPGPWNVFCSEYVFFPQLWKRMWICSLFFFFGNSGQNAVNTQMYNPEQGPAFWNLTWSDPRVPSGYLEVQLVLLGSPSHTSKYSAKFILSPLPQRKQQSYQGHFRNHKNNHKAKINCGSHNTENYGAEK